MNGGQGLLVTTQVFMLHIPYAKVSERTIMETPHREPQEHSRNIVGRYHQGPCIPIIFLPYSWGFLFGFPLRVLKP